ncbi:MAG TPA: lysylphosphatidylglycerol synthase transmembrane domain-containing protein [Streptosporangiaceae bacterium]|nr:lysylphosphatidylglycerol synthase transmembrane domain-containing protein [Streptosporangiaceae bacterium]
MPAPAARVPPEQALRVEDDEARRIRKPIDLLRCAAACAGIALLAAVGLLARAITTGVETDVVGASHRIPSALLSTLGVAATLALWALPAALAAWVLVRRQPRRLVEALLTGALAATAAALADAVLRTGVGSQLYDAITMSQPGVSHITPLDIYLAALAAYVTIIDITGRPRLLAALWVVFGVYAIESLASLRTTVLAVLITLLLGRAIGLAVRYGAGSVSRRPSAQDIAAALRSAGQPVTELRRTPPPAVGSRRYAAVTADGGRLDVTVFDRDQQAAGALYRLYRSLRLRDQVSRRVPLSTDRAVERMALMAYSVEDAGVGTPRLRALVRAGSEAVALATEHQPGRTLAQWNGSLTDQQLERVWDVVLRLHAHRVTHRALTADRILITDGGEVQLLEPGSGDVAASDLQLRLDLAQLLAELATLVGPDRAASQALRKAGPRELIAVAPLLQPVVLYRSTRATVRRHKDILPTLRARLLATVPAGDAAAPVQLERIRLRTLVTLVASLVAAYVLLGQLARVDLVHIVRAADVRWMLVALVLSALTYPAAALSLSGFVPRKLPFGRTVLAQLAGSFVTLVTPVAVGGAALNIRYLQRSKVPAAVAAASVSVAQVVAFALHITLLIVFVAITGASRRSLSPPTWSYFVLAGLVALAGVALAVPQWRRLLRARLAPTIGQVVPRLLGVLQQPPKLAAGIGGALLLTGCYILCLETSVLALGGSISLAAVAVVYLTGNALGSVVPTPGGIGAVEAALSAGLTAAGMPGATAVSAVLLFRALTFWLPVPLGWGAFSYLQRRQFL